MSSNHPLFRDAWQLSSLIGRESASYCQELVFGPMYIIPIYAKLLYVNCYSAGVGSEVLSYFSVNCWKSIIFSSRNASIKTYNN